MSSISATLPEAKNLRRVAASTVIYNDGTEYHNHVLELNGSRVVNHYPLRGELPMTEWLGGTIVVEHYRACHISVLADGTQRRQWL